jgi:8-oxo-dGTP diphosphatase
MSLKKKYQHVVVAVDVAIFTIIDNSLKVLLIKLKKKPYEQTWALPGGLIHSDESLEQAAERELRDRTGLQNVYLEQLYTFGRIDRDPFGRVVSTAYFALVSAGSVELERINKTEDVAWFSITQLPELGYDHAEMIASANERIQAKLKYSNIVYALLPREFTLTTLQTTYEIILNRKLDKRNFRKKILSLNLISAVGKKVGGVPNRPAELYRFIRQQPHIVDML